MRLVKILIWCDGKNPMALKYTGEVSLPVTKILVYDGKNWVNS